MKPIHSIHFIKKEKLLLFQFCCLFLFIKESFFSSAEQLLKRTLTLKNSYNLFTIRFVVLAALGVDRNVYHWSPQGELGCRLYPVQHHPHRQYFFNKKTAILVLILCITDLDLLIQRSSIVIHAFVVVLYLSQHHWAI